MAGAMLANRFVWVWLLALGYFSSLFARVLDILLADATYIIYLSGGTAPSYLVSKRAALRHLAVGLKIAVLAWVFSIILMPSISIEPSIGFAITLLVCFVGGGIAGAYLALSSRLRTMNI